jgi:hypothetical protein
MPVLPQVAGDTGWGECAALLRDDFASFAARCFRELNSRTPSAANWHFALVAAKLAAVRQGQGSQRLEARRAMSASYCFAESQIINLTGRYVPSANIALTGRGIALDRG